LFAEQEGKPYSNAKLSNLPAGELGADLVPDALPKTYRSAEAVDALPEGADKARRADEAEEAEEE
jgi:hypothetical protein